MLAPLKMENNVKDAFQSNFHKRLKNFEVIVSSCGRNKNLNKTISRTSPELKLKDFKTSNLNIMSYTEKKFQSEAYETINIKVNKNEGIRISLQA